MIRKIQTRSGKKRNFYHQNSQSHKPEENDIIRPPTSHPYLGYKHLRSESHMRSKYSPAYFINRNVNVNFKEQESIFQNSLSFENLSYPFKLYFQQIQLFFKGKNISQEKTSEFQEIIKNLSKSIQDLSNKNKNLEISVELKQIKIKELEEMITSQNYETKNSNKKLTVIQKPKQKKICDQLGMQMMLENCRLSELTNQYLNIIQQLKKKKEHKAEFSTQNEEQRKQHDTELLRCQNRISYLQMKLVNAERVQNEYSSENQKMKKKIGQLQRSLKQYDAKMKSTKQKLNQWREKALMQKEQSQLNVSRQQFLLFSMKKLRENNKSLMEKLINQNKSSDMSSNQALLLPNPNFQYETDFFKSIPVMYRNSKRKQFKMNTQEVKNELGIEVQDLSIDADYQNYKKNETFDVAGMKYYRPTFFSFLEESTNPDIQNCRTKGNASVSRIFIQVMRAITKSKLNQFIYEPVEKYTRFPEFVYSWFQKYYFHSEMKCIQALQPFMQKPFNQELFYRDLMNVKLDQSWEIITFRQFLLEELSLEELYFYLMCQNALFSRSGITEQTLFTGDFTILVEYSVAKSVLDMVLSDFESWNLTFLTSKLRQKVIIRQKTEMIESGFFLRCLIQYYKIERCNRVRYIYKLFSEFQNQKNGLRFSSFMSVMGKFTEVPIDVKLQLYRDCFCLTKGMISPESIFIVCSENLVFLKFLKLRTFFRLPKLIHRPMKLTGMSMMNNNKEELKKKKELICVQPSDSYLYEIFISFERLIKEDELQKRMEALGVYNLNSHFLNFSKLFDEKNTDIDSSFLKCKHFLHFIQICLESIRSVNFYNLYELFQEQNKKKSLGFWVDFQENELGQIFTKEINAVLDVYQQINSRRVWKNKVYNFRLHHAAKKIQKQVRKKIIQPYMNIYNVICNEIKKDKKQIEE